MKILEILKKSTLTELVGVVTPSLILIGVSYKFGFYGSANINASWIIPTFSPVNLIMANMEIYLYYSVATLYMSYVFDEKDEDRWKGAIIAIATLLGLGLFYYLIVDMPLTYFLMIVSSFIAIFMIIYRGYVGKIIGILLILLGIPYQYGFTQAKNIKIQELPEAVIKDKKEQKQWYILDQFSDKAILINHDNHEKNFRIIELKEIEKIKNYN